MSFRSTRSIYAEFYAITKYFHEDRLHDSLAKDTPNRRIVEQRSGVNAKVVSIARLGVCIIATSGTGRHNRRHSFKPPSQMASQIRRRLKACSPDGARDSPWAAAIRTPDEMVRRAGTTPGLPLATEDVNV